MTQQYTSFHFAICQQFCGAKQFVCCILLYRVWYRLNGDSSVEKGGDYDSVYYMVTSARGLWGGYNQ